MGQTLHHSSTSTSEKTVKLWRCKAHPFDYIKQAFALNVICDGLTKLPLLGQACSHKSASTLEEDSCGCVGLTLLTMSSRLSPSMSSSPIAAKGRVTSVSSSSGRFRVINPFLSRIQKRLAASSKSRPCCRQTRSLLHLGGISV